VETFEPEEVDCLPSFQRRTGWFLDHHPEVPEHIDLTQKTERGPRMLISIASRAKVERVLKYALAENEFLSPAGIRSLSKFHRDHPFIISLDGEEHRVDYEPAESASGLFGGNSNWRGPIWFPLNFLLIEALQRYHHYYGDSFQVEFPTGSGQKKNLWDVAAELSHRLVHPFLLKDGRRPIYGDNEIFAKDPNWRDLLLFHEYFNGDTGKGLGACNQTGWTALVAKLLEQVGQ
jgi:hypothetical protein